MKRLFDNLLIQLADEFGWKCNPEKWSYIIIKRFPKISGEYQGRKIGIAYSDPIFGYVHTHVWIDNLGNISDENVKRLEEDVRSQVPKKNSSFYIKLYGKKRATIDLYFPGIITDKNDMKEIINLLISTTKK